MNGSKFLRETLLITILKCHSRIKVKALDELLCTNNSLSKLCTNNSTRTYCKFRIKVYESNLNLYEYLVSSQTYRLLNVI